MRISNLSFDEIMAYKAVNDLASANKYEQELRELLYGKSSY